MIERSLFLEQVRPFIDKPMIKVISGMRRCGKSVFLRQLRDLLISEKALAPEDVIYLELDSLRNAALRDYMALYKYVEERAQARSNRVYILLDEVQEVAEWERAVNSFITDIDCDIYLTGSNARMLSSELATYLTGRYVEFKLYPFSFAEFCQFYAEAATERSRTELFERYLRCGGLPGTLSTESDVSRVIYVNDIFGNILLRDVVQRFKIRDIDLLDRVTLFVMDNLGNTFSAKAIANFLKSEQRRLGVETIYNYLKALESAFFMERVRRYDLRGKRFLETQEKFFLMDWSVLSAEFSDNFTARINGILENMVYLELRRRRYQVFIGKAGTKEIDFVAEKNGARIYLQVAYLLPTAETYEREFDALRSIKDNYPKYVLTLDPLPPSDDAGIKRLHLADFLLDRSWG